MVAGFHELHTVVPERARAGFRVGYVTLQDYQSGRLTYDPTVMDAVESRLEAHRLCMIAAPRSRGKTVLAKTVGLRRSGAINSKYHAYYSPITTIDVSTALEFIHANNSHTRDRFLFIVEDCHSNVDRSERFIESLLNFDFSSASVLLTTREVGTQILSNHYNAAAELDRLGLVVRLRPDRRFIRRIVEALGREELVDLNTEVDRLVSLSGEITDLSIVAETLNYASAEGVSVDALTEEDILRSVVDNKLSEAATRRLLLEVAAIAQYDVGVHASYAELGGGNELADRLVGAGILRRATSANPSGLYYWLDETSEAEILLRAAETHGLFQGQSQDEFVSDQICRYLRARPPNVLELLYGVRAQKGRCFVRDILGRQSSVDTLAAAARGERIGRVAGLLSVCRQSDAKKAWEFFRAWCELRGGEEKIAEEVASAHMWEWARFLAEASAIGANVVPLGDKLEQNLISEELSASKGRLLLRVISLAHSGIPRVWNEIERSSSVILPSIANALRTVPLQTAMWFLREFEDEGGPIRVASILDQLGGGSWIGSNLAGEALSVVGGVLVLLKEEAPLCYRDVVRELDYDVLADSARVDNSNGLHRWLPSVPLPYRKKLLDGLSSEDWRGILGRSSLAGIANLLDDLKHHPLGDTGGRVARYIAEADLSCQFAEGRIGLVGRIMRNMNTLDSSAADIFGRKVAGLKSDALRRLANAEPPAVRLDRIGLLLFALRSAKLEMARTVVGKLVDEALVREVPRTPLSKLQWFIYNVYTVDPERVRSWLAAMPNGMAMSKLVEADNLENVMWMIWNVARVDAGLAKRWNESYLARGEATRLWRKADLRCRLAYQGLCHLLDLQSPKERGESVRGVIDAVDQAPSPSYACLALYGAGVGRNENYRKNLLRSMDVRKLEENIAKVREYGADAVMQKLLDAIDPSGSTSGRGG